MITLLVILLFGFAGMLAIMGTQQWQRQFRIAAAFSLVTAVLLAIVGIWVLLIRFGML